MPGVGEYKTRKGNKPALLLGLSAPGTFTFKRHRRRKVTNTMQPDNDFMTAGAREKEFMEHIEKSKNTRLTLFEALAQHPNEFHNEIQDEADIERVRAAVENAEADIEWLRSQAKLLDQARSGASIALEMATGELLPLEMTTTEAEEAKREYVEAIDSVESLFQVLQVYGDAENGPKDPDAMFGVGKAGRVMVGRVRDSVSTLVD